MDGRERERVRGEGGDGEDVGELTGGLCYL